jgi:hypothetical protein
MVLYLCVLIVFSLRRESLKLILATDPFLRWFCHTASLILLALARLVLTKAHAEVTVVSHFHDFVLSL